MDADKRAFYEAAARGMAASTLMYGVDSIVHVEDKDDIWFWQQLLAKYRGGRYKFKPATINEKGNRNTGCTQCLKYKGFLSQKFFICIDSDLRYLLDEAISAEDGILQTYTYSWENHCAFASQLQQTFDKYTHKGKEFDFSVFLSGYSEVVYEAFLLMLYQLKNGLTEFDRDKFRTIISLQYRRGDEKNNGKQFLDRLSLDLQTATKNIKDTCGFNMADESVYYETKGLRKENVYLYVRGHCLYNSLVSIGKKLCEGTGMDFEQNILKNALAFEQYDAISRIKADIGILKTIRRSY
ncbi:DUF4435 domain-containing protein [Phocaeicola plebeius]|uniref:DUF4435 domain-containing protein n=1 Tax=Phocaeicola plebeius TaxID=310297 RepID=UPI001957D0DF|nr:DUF4435 domain-containing protein [Phocaeicola plebeius]MBM6963937.1 DUF4435 domain-containing protein [Phocaeicola plebeius]